MDQGGHLVPARGVNIQNRYDALQGQWGVERTGDERPVAISKILQVVQAIEEIAPRAQGLLATGDLSGSGFIPIHTVPQDERWEVSHATRFGSTGATTGMATVDGVSIIIGTEGTAQGQFLSNPIRLEPGDAIGMTSSGNAADTAIALAITITRYLVAVGTGT
jgi:hypothetical protein